MTNAELFSEGLNLMFAGMGFVIFFLLALIYAISFISSLINRYFPEPIPSPTPKTIQPAVDDLERLRPVIAAAIAHHRRMKGQN
ncbi:oxaloacetate decarboxylase subunit gamma [Mannheimia sp. USDA-ARS-USMARC-1261]|uniref:oxaloacetate decarboxylase subunit gamma n=1 Tax=Mannheimia sp. USDA-ARS-USMARC-1261 TaxID=1432056 RepID=UPI00046D206D|nr:oxaloacetate decarboxylase subunit gamma [Mannheimia sp. USDA-ARS-USMARC-1261]